jgi:hypothetical protein
MQGRFLLVVILGFAALGCEHVAETISVDAPGLYALASTQGGDGTYSKPFGTLAELEAASSPGDTLYLITSAMPFTDKIALKVGQKLIGIAADGLPGTTVVHGSDEHPVILLGGANEVANLSLEQLQGHGIAGVGVDLSGTLIHNVAFIGLLDASYEDFPNWAIYFEVNAGVIKDVRVEDIVVRDAGAHGGIHVLHTGTSSGGYVFQRNRFDTLGGRALHTWSQNYSRIYTEFLDSSADNIGVGVKNADSVLPHLSNRSQQDMLVKDYHYKNTKQVGSPSNTGIEAFIMGAPFAGEGLWCDGCRLLLTIEDTIIQDSVTDGIQLTNFGSNSAFDIKIRNTQILHANPQQVGGGISLYAQNDKNTGSQTTLMIENSKVIDSQKYGVSVLDTGEGYTATVDLGGGALGSAGGNTITGSVLGEVQLTQATAVAKGVLWGIEPPRVQLEGDLSAIDLGQ